MVRDKLGLNMADQEMTFSFNLDMKGFQSMLNQMETMIGNMLKKVSAKTETTAQSEKNQITKKDLEREKEELKTKSRSSMIGGMAMGAMGSFMSPTRSYQEKIAEAVPQAAAIATSFIGTKLLGTGLSEDSTRRISEAVGQAVSTAYEKMQYVAGGARQSVSSYAERMARLGYNVDEKTGKEMLRYEMNARQREYEKREEVAGWASDVGSEPGRNLFNIEGVMSSLMETLARIFEGLPGGIMEALKGVMGGLDDGMRRVTKVVQGDQ